jgi:hypothetical protein
MFKRLGYEEGRVKPILISKTINQFKDKNKSDEEWMNDIQERVISETSKSWKLTSEGPNAYIDKY